MATSSSCSHRTSSEFAAPFGPLGGTVEPLLRWYLCRLVCRHSSSSPTCELGGLALLEMRKKWVLSPGVETLDLGAG
ncbi:MAG: hypothetical protein KY461_10625 [Actinobacteria bacterium]|nr:hypothetical protein [Actinomycetota bacterium]